MLTQQQIDFYRENGYLLVKGLFSREQALTLRNEAHALAERLTNQGMNIDATWGSAKSADPNAGVGATKILHCHDVQFHSAAFSRARYCGSQRKLGRGEVPPAFRVVGQTPMFMTTRHHTNAPLFQRRVIQMDDHRDHRVVYVREVRAVLMKRER